MMDECEADDKSWKIFVKKHWNMLAFWIIAGAVAVVGAVLVYLWFVGEAQATEMVPAVLGQWSMSHMITFLLHLASIMESLACQFLFQDYQVHKDWRLGHTPSFVPLHGL